MDELTRNALQVARAALMIHSKHYECEDDYYSCPASDSAWEDRKGECCCGSDAANSAIKVIDKALGALT